MIRRTREADRPGVILLIVLALLTIFTLLGLSFVMYSDAAATRARIFREAGIIPRVSDTAPQTRLYAADAWEDFLGKVIYDVNDDAVGCTSVLRGHSLGRTMYGWTDNGGTPVYALNDRPFTGTGRF